MIEPSLRTLPPLAPSREFFGNNLPRATHNYQHQPHHIHTPPEEPIQENTERSGDCLVILPFSRSAFRGSQHAGPNKCECSSFFMSPGDPNSCLCGHPASCHGPKPSGSEASTSNQSSPFIPPQPLFTPGYTGSMLSPPISVQHLSPTRSNSYHHEDIGLTPAILTRLAQLEKLLASEIQARQILQENQKYIQLNQQRLSQQCRCLSEELDLIIAKSGESARESLDLEVLNLKQKKMADDIERMKGAIEGLDERTEDLEFRNEDLEKWVEEQKEEKKVVATERRGERCERDDENEPKAVTHKENGAPRRKAPAVATMTGTAAQASPSAKRRRCSLSDTAPPPYESSCITPSIHNMITGGTAISNPTTANKRFKAHSLNRE